MGKNLRKVIFSSLLSLSLCLCSSVTFAQTKEEYLDKFLDNVYTIMLERESDEEGKLYWKNEIIEGKLGILDFLNQILDQEEFGQIDISNEEFIYKNYELLMNREPDAEGFEYWVNRLEGDSTQAQKLELINQMAHSDEFINEVNSLGILFKKYKEPEVDKPQLMDPIDLFIQDAYTYLFNREYDIDGFNYWRDQLTSQNKGAIDLINNFISQDEFKARNLSDSEFISAVYEVLFDRSVDSDGLTYWNNIYSKDKSSNRQANIVLEIADSSEFLDRIKNLNIIFKKIDLNLFYSELLTSQNKVREITSSQLSEIKKGMTFFDIIVKLGRTRNVSDVDGVNTAKYIVDGSREFYLIFSDPVSTYKFNPMDVLNAQK